MSFRERFSAIAPSALLKDAFLGGVGIVAVKIVYTYLKALSAKPEILASMGPGVILGLLGITLTAVLLNRAIDVAANLLDKFVDAFTSGIDRMAKSSEQTATSSQETAISVRQLAEAQMASAHAAEQAANKDDRQLQQVENLVGVLVVNVKRLLRKMHGQDRALERLENHAGINRSEVLPHDDDEEEGEEGRQ